MEREGSLPPPASVLSRMNQVLSRLFYFFAFLNGYVFNNRTVKWFYICIYNMFVYLTVITGGVTCYTFKSCNRLAVRSMEVFDQGKGYALVCGGASPLCTCLK